MLKEEAEKPEKEAKDQHQKLWEGTSRAGCDLFRLLAGKMLSLGDSCSASVTCCLCWLDNCV